MSARDGSRSFAGIVDLIEHARKCRSSDIHIDPEFGVALRIETEIRRLPDWHVSADQARAFLERAFDRVARVCFDAVGQADAMYRTADVAARVHAARGRHGPRLSLRLLNSSIPSLDALGLPTYVAGMTSLRSGLALIVGPHRSGKSTMLAGLIADWNEHRHVNIVTVESPVEYTFLWRTAIVSQYEVGRDVATFAQGVRGAIRADPDVVVVGELGDQETIEATLRAAEEGHLVLAAMTTPLEGAGVLGRIAGMFPVDEQPRIRCRLADALVCVVALRLLGTRNGESLLPAVEILPIAEPLRRIIREGAWHQIRPILAAPRKDGGQTLERHLSELVAYGAIDIDSARTAANYPNEVVPSVTAVR